MVHIQLLLMDVAGSIPVSRYIFLKQDPSHYCCRFFSRSGWRG